MNIRMVSISTRFLLFAVLMSGCIGCTASAQQGVVLHPFRELKFYTTSAPVADDAQTVHATMQVHNEAGEARTLVIELDANAQAGFDGATYSFTVEADDARACTFTLRPAAGLSSTVITGRLRYDSADAPVDRDLHIAVRGPDPQDDSSDDTERITASAQVVATYAPRAWARVEAAANAARASRAAGPRHVIAAKGKAFYDIALVTGEAPGPLDLDAASTDQAASPARRDLVAAIGDLKRCIDFISDADIRVVNIANAKADRQRRIVLDPAALTGEGLHPDTYAIRVTDSGDIHIRAATEDGLRQGIYGFLVDHLDCHWFQPRELGEELPRRDDRTAAVGAIDEVQSPTWFSVNGMSWGNSPRWDRRNRALVNRGRMTFGHAWANYITPAAFPYDEHPDMWARDREGKILKKDVGWTSTNFCSTNPKVIEIVAEKVNAKLSANPDAIVASLDPNDYAPMCLCDRCIELDKSYGVTKLDGTEVADRLVHFARQIHDRLDPAHKDRYLGILIYGYQMELPVSAKPHDRYAAMICNFPPRYDHSRPWNDPTSAWNRDFYRLVKGWGAMVKQFGYYDYYGHYYFFGPYAMIHKMREDLPAFRDLGGTYLMIEAQPNFAMQGLNLYIAARLAWDVDADVDLLLHEFCERYYGPAAEPMRKFWRTAERYYALERPGKRTEMRVGAHDGFWRELEKHLDEAERSVVNQGPDAQRYRDRLAFHRDGFDFGRFHYTFASRYMDRRGNVMDAEGGLAFLRANRPRMDAIRGKYEKADDYWPSLIGYYFYPDLDRTGAILQAKIDNDAP